MTLTLTYIGGDTLTIEGVQSLRIVTDTTLETNTYGNGPVYQREVRSFTVAWQSPSYPAINTVWVLVENANPEHPEFFADPQTMSEHKSEAEALKSLLRVEADARSVGKVIQGDNDGDEDWDLAYEIRKEER